MNQRKKRSTILDIAREANLTDGTVSRALRGSPLVKPATREHVLKIAEKLGYRSFAAGRGLVTGRTNTLGFISPSLRYPLNAEIAEALQAAVGEKGYGLVVTSLDNHDERTVSRMKMLSEHCVDGIIFQPTQSRKDIPCIDMIERYKIPFVVTTEVQQANVSFVGFDDYDGARQLTRHILTRGYRRPGFITGWSSLAGTPAQVRGFREVLTEFGVDPDRCPVCHQEEFTSAAIRKTIGGLLEKSLELDCLLIVDTKVMIHAYWSLRDRSIRVGPDMGLAGFSDNEWFEDENSSLTCLEYPLDRMAQSLVEIVLKRIETPGAPVRREYVTPTLIARNSTRR